MRLIDADALINKMCHHCEDGDGEGACAEVCRFAEAVSNIPTLDCEPVRHGEWEKNTADEGWFRELLFCSVCGVGTLPYPTKYCPSCGAKMDGGKER